MDETESVRRFERNASAARPRLTAELWAFLKTNKKWWLTPILLMLLLAGLLVMLSTTAAAPFVYTMF